jgi:phosphoserine aminotransferase
MKLIATFLSFILFVSCANSKETNYTTIPKELSVSPTATYLHITTNETIAGTQWKDLPYDCGVPLVADMSSDILAGALILLSLT